MPQLGIGAGLYLRRVCFGVDRSDDLRSSGDEKTSVKNSFLGGLQMLSIFRRLAKNDRGATAIEYTLIALLIAIAAIVSMGSVGAKVNGALSNVANVTN
jgi:pilus assembly protein Flp/PilA